MCYFSVKNPSSTASAGWILRSRSLSTGFASFRRLAVRNRLGNRSVSRPPDPDRYMPRFRLLIAYDGRDFHGWQRQPEVETVQGALERALTVMNAGRPMTIAGASRTDAGVHAEGQVAVFDYEGPINERSFFRGLNTLTPRSISVREVARVSDDFHPRFRAIGKHYRYTLWTRPHLPPELYRRALGLKQCIELEPMREAARLLLGEHDFSAFRASTCDATHPVRTLYSIDITRTDHYLYPIEEESGRCVHIDVRGNAFLKNMVRILVGTFLDVGQGRRKPQEVVEILASREREKAGPTVLPDGLCLMKVFFEPSLALGDLSLQTRRSS